MSDRLPGWRFPRWIAHRGAGRLAPENTLAAFRAGAALGYRAFECDVKLSADGVPFLLHDATLDRTTDGTGPAAALDWTRLARLDAGVWHGRAFAGEPLPAFDALGRWCVANGHALDVEIKPSPGRERETGAAVAEAAARLFARAEQPPFLTSFQPDALAAAREASPDLPRGLLLDTLREGWLDEALGLGCRAVVTHFAQMGSEVRETLRAHGLAALVYTVNDPAEVLRLHALGIDGIVTDAVQRFAPGLDDGGA